MSLIWRSFIPYHILQELTEKPGAAPTSWERRFHAVALFADVSGFTAISEALGSVSKGGAEELTALLNGYFGPMIDLIHSYGGIVAKFGGDAMTAFFPYTTETYDETACRAIQCALDMQAKMVDYQAIQTQAGVFSLAMKAGLAAGQLFSAVVGHPILRLESIIAGAVLDRAAEAEHHAQKGEVVVHQDLFAASDCIEPERAVQRGEFSLVNTIAGAVSPAPLAPIAELSPETIETIAAFIPPSIVQRIKIGQTSFINEHRKATVLFVGFQGFDYDHDLDVGSKLQTYLYRVIQIVERYDGYLNKVDMGDKGSKYIILFGAPIAHEDDEERALRCALDLQALTDAPVRIGVNTGFVYSGQVGSVGSEARQEYTVMGDAVNLAARLMQAAESGQTIVNEEVCKSTAAVFAWEGEQTLRLKGKTVPTKVYTLRGLERTAVLQLQEPSYALPMVGREAELQTIQRQMSQALAGQGQIIGITAEAGMGKSRLSAEAIKLAISEGFAGYGGECLSHGVNTSYLVWKNLLRGLFGLDTTRPLAQQMQQLEAHLSAIDPGLAQRMPLLSRALNLPIPDNDLTRPMDAKLRKASREALIVDCIHHAAETAPLLLVLEDCHWIDALSNDLLQAVGRHIANIPVAMLVIYRPPEAERIQPQVMRLGHFTEIRLAEFTRSEAEKLIGLKLIRFFGGLGSVPATFVERITERAQGNPFYIDEMINLIRDREIDPSDADALETLDLPGSLHSLIISRLDQLAESAKTTLKVASVIGRLFRARWLWEVYPQLGAPERVREQLTLLNKLDITPVETPDSDDLEYLFKHILTREVAYESLAVATRQMLHEQIGLYIETSFPAELDQYVDLLAYHFGLSRNKEKQKAYFRQAGEAAQAVYANESAIAYYERLLPLLLGAEQGRAMLELGSVWQLIGKWDDAENVYRQALAIAEELGDQRLLAQCEHKRGALLRFKGAYEEALNWLTKAQEKFETLDDQLGLSAALMEAGIVYWSQGDYARALSLFERCQQIAESVNNLRGIYRAVGNMGNVFWIQGQYDRALGCHERCQQIADELDDRLGAGVAIGNIGNIYYEQHDYPRALTFFMQYLYIALELGYRHGVEIAIGNMGEVYAKQGDYRSSLACYRYNLSVALEIGDRVGVSFAILGMAKAYIGRGDWETADSLLQQAVKIGRLLNIPYELCEYLFTRAGLLARQEAYSAAQSVNDEALRLATEVGHPQVQFEARLMEERLRFAAKEGALDGTRRSLRQMLDDDLDEASRADVLYELQRLDGRSEREETAVLYQKLYEQTPNIKYKRRYETLTDKTLPAPPDLSPAPQIVTDFTTPLATLLQQVDAFIEELTD
ncbi:MAG: tetratricopeptide repeat protein [Chloroflexi bacterium]|nr:tetratricopeptide repeat protein [Chloroflexota bacterium]